MTREEQLRQRIAEDNRLDQDFSKQIALHSGVHPFGLIALLARQIIRWKKRRYVNELNDIVRKGFGDD